MSVVSSMAPEFLADQYDVRRACYVVYRTQIAAELRFEAKHGQESGAGANTAKALRRALSGADRKIDRFASYKCEVGKALLTRVPIEPVHVASSTVVKNV